MQTDVLIVGQGICGTFLSWYLERAGLSCIVIDEARPYTASKAAAGIINPVTGRRLVTTWMIEELLPFAETAYEDLGAALGGRFFEQKEMIDFFPSAQMRLAFLDRFKADPAYLQLPTDEHSWDPIFSYQLGYGSISPCYLVDLPGLLRAARSRLQGKGMLREEKFEHSALTVESSSAGGGAGQSASAIHYRDITASKLIFCDGIESAGQPYFSKLPFAPNKGEALLLEIPGLPPGIFKKGMTLAPWSAGKELFWMGSSYQWSFDHAGPTEEFRERTVASLQEWLKLPFRVVDHMASVRPATLERRPFVGFHPTWPAVGILNGMGTKGCSLAPFFASQLVDHIISGKAIRADADVKRFSKILSR